MKSRCILRTLTLAWVAGYQTPRMTADVVAGLPAASVVVLKAIAILAGICMALIGAVLQGLSHPVVPDVSLATVLWIVVFEISMMPSPGRSQRLNPYRGDADRPMVPKCALPALLKAPPG